MHGWQHPSMPRHLLLSTPPAYTGDVSDTSVIIPRSVQDRLVAAATDLFAVRGYHATRVSDIVRQAGVAQGTFYLYFAHKEALFVHLVDAFFAGVLATTLGTYRPETALTPGDVLTQARTIWRTTLTRCRDERALVSLILREATGLGPAVTAHVQANQQRVVDGLAAFVAQGSASGLLRPVDPQFAGWVILGMLERAVFYAVVSRDGADLDRLADDLAVLELRGLLADGGAPAP